jgi:hypothetical protein
MDARTTQQIDAEITDLRAQLETVRGSKTEVYARIVGYYRSVRNWNKGKREEFGVRKLFNVPGQAELGQAMARAGVEGVECAAAIAAPGAVSGDACDSATGAATFTMERASVDMARVRGYVLFMRKTCPNCPPVKDYLGELAIESRIIDVDSDEGFALATERGIFAAPTVLLVDSEGAEVGRAHNVAELRSYFEGVVA